MSGFPPPPLPPMEKTTHLLQHTALCRSFLPGEVDFFEEDFEAPAYEPNEGVKSFLREIDNDPGRVWELDEIQLVEQVHNQLELALENANLFQQTQEALAETDEQARKLRLLNEMSELLSQAETVDRISQIAAETAYKVFKATQASTAVWTEDRDFDASHCRSWHWHRK